MKSEIDSSIHPAAIIAADKAIKNKVTMSSGTQLFDALTCAFRRHRSLVWELAKRDVLGRYRGASLGLFWSLITPIAMLAVYVIAFGGVMNAKWSEAEANSTSFALVVFSGLIVHSFFAEVLIRAPGLVVQNPNFVKKIIFPLEILPWPPILSALFHLGVNFLVLLIFLLAFGERIPWTVIFTPIVVLPLVFLSVGICLLLSSLGVYVRDISQMMGPIATASLFLSTAIVPMSAVPEKYRVVFELNPLTFIINQVREVTLWKRLPDWEGIGLYLAISLLVFVSGAYFFQRTKQGFADVL